MGEIGKDKKRKWAILQLKDSKRHLRKIWELAPAGLCCTGAGHLKTCIFTIFKMGVDSDTGRILNFVLL